jgi:uncharacterized protein YqgC (DUF456 family)
MMMTRMIGRRRTLSSGVVLGPVREGRVDLDDKQWLFRLSTSKQHLLQKLLPTTINHLHLHFGLMRLIYPTVPNKPILFLGLLACLFSGSMTPIFSFLLSRLLFEVSSGAQDVSMINQFGGLVLGIAAMDGLFLGLKYYVMDYCGMSWITHLRTVAIQKILKQDKKWFDRH